MKINYKSTQNFWALITGFVKSLIFDFISEKRLNLFVRTNDIISVSPLLEGTHEPQILDFFSCAATAGYSDFLIDIGGNIGLTSCLASRHFSSIHVYEINPLAFKILEVNVSSSMDFHKFYLNDYGIGAFNGKTTLVVPKHNWGGAYIDDDGNSYSNEVLAKKDGFTHIVKDNYNRSEVSIKKGSEEFMRVFHRQMKKFDRPIKGVIKIDVEGYERTVIKELVDSNRDGVDLLVVFENWDKSLSSVDIRNEFEGENIKLSKISRRAPFPRNAPKLVKIILFILMAPLGLAKYQYYLKEIKPGDLETSLLGDLVLELSGRNI